MRYVQRVACPGSGGRPSIHSPASANSGVPYRTEAWRRASPRRSQTWQGYAIATGNRLAASAACWSRAIATTGAASPYTATSDATSSRLPRSAGSMCRAHNPLGLTSLYGPDGYTARTARPDFFGRTPARPRALRLFPRKRSRSRHSPRERGSL